MLPTIEARITAQSWRRVWLRMWTVVIMAVALTGGASAAQGATRAPGGTILVVEDPHPAGGAQSPTALWRTALPLAPVQIQVPGGGRLNEITRSADGKRIAYVVNGQMLRQMNSDGTQARLLFSVPSGSFARISAPRYAPNGATLAFTAGCCGSFTSYLIGTDGSGLRRLPGAGLRFVQDWSPDGKHLLITVNGALWETNARGLKGHALGGDAPEAGSFFNARYSPDGSHIVAGLTPAQGEEATNKRIVILHVDGTYLSVLTRGLPWDTDQPTWSADGKWIAFVAASGALGPAGRLHDLWLMRYDGTQRQDLTRGKLGDVQSVVWAR